MKNKLLERITRFAAHPARAIALFVAICSASAVMADVPTATAVWETGEFKDAASLHGGYSIDLQGNTINSSGNIVTQSSATKAALIKITDVVSDGASAVTILYKYKTISAPGGIKVPVSVYLGRLNGEAGEDFGAINWGANNLGLLFVYQVSSSVSGYWRDTGGVLFTDPMATSGGVLLFSFSKSGTTGTANIYQGATFADMTGGTKTGVPTNLSTYDGTIEYIGLGGPTAKTASYNYGGWPGIEIEKVAIFIGNAYTKDQLVDYKWPSEENASYVATISGDTTWSDSMWAETATWENGQDASITVTDDAVFTIPSTISIGNLTFTIADGKTLTLNSEGTISQIVANGGSIAFSGTTATTQYPISGTSVIKVPDNTQLTVNAAVTTSGGFNIGANATLVAPHAQVSSSTGAFTGGLTATVKMPLSSGTANLYDQTSPYNNWKFSDSSTWNGTVVLSGTCGVWKMIQFGNSTSKVVIDGLESYIATYKSDTQNDWHNIGTLEIAPGGWKVTGGYTSGVMVFPATLTGSGDITVSISGSTRLFFTGNTRAFTGGITIKDTTASDYTGGFGAVTTACQVHIIPTASATADPTQLANTGYTANTIAVGAGGEATVASTATWTAPGGFIVNGTLNLGSASGLDSAGTLKGTGMIVMPSATLPGSDLQTLLQKTNWQGTLAISNQTVSELNPNLYGNEGSKVQLSGMSGWFVKPRTTPTISPEVVFENGSYSYAFKPTNGYSYNSGAGNDGNNAANYNIFKKISGSGTLAQDSDKGYSQLYWIKDGSEFTGSVVHEAATSTIIVFAGNATEPSTEEYDETYAVSTLHVLSGASATLGAGSTWQPGSAIKISGAVEIAGSGTMVNPVTLNDGATLTFDALDSSAAALSLSSTLTANSTVKIAFGSGVIPAAGLKLMKWVKTGSTATAVAFALADVSLPYELSVVEGETYNTLVLADVDVTVDGISIPDTWLASTATEENITVAALAAKINAGTAAANGRTYDVCYALGLSTTDATDDFIIAVTSVNGTLTAVLRHSDGTEITAASGVALTVTLKYGNGVAAMTNPTVGTSGASSTFAIDPAQGDFGETGAIFYKIEIAISASGS